MFKMFEFNDDGIVHERPLTSVVQRNTFKLKVIANMPEFEIGSAIVQNVRSWQLNEIKWYDKYHRIIRGNPWDVLLRFNTKPLLDTANLPKL